MEKLKKMTWCDMFAGGGGTSCGLHNIKGINVIAALNHWHNAVKTHKINFQGTKHYWADVYDTNEHLLPQCDGFWASIDCTDHSNAKGGQAKDAGSYMLADELPRFVAHCNPSTIVIENVREFLKWGPLDNEGKRIKSLEGFYFREWIQKIIDLGYSKFQYRLLNVADWGEYTSRTRLIIIFTKKDIDITWPEPTHHKKNENGLKLWNACKEKINLENEGASIFGKQYNMDIPPQARRKPVKNSMKRYAGGIKKFHPKFNQWLLSYYGSGLNATSLENPCPVITTKDRHVLVTAKINEEKFQFVTDHIWGAQMQDLEKPMKTITTWESKSIVTVEKKQFVSDQTFSTENKNESIEEPIKTLVAQQRKQLITVEHHIATANNSNGNPELNVGSVDEPLKAITTREKHQFITSYFNSGGNPESQNQSPDKPLNAITGVNKQALTTIEQFLDSFDIKSRFLTYKELADITGFPQDYKWIGSQKDIIRMIGNAVPPKLAEIIGKECIKNFNNSKNV